ncbi:DUF5994 family protein [Streptomonospora algeriensis]|uniref:DUF5994 family protein n=1 Tax=Streptomonospora algeriensis TaxID=995084 RepID=A0ABW3B9J1_9ACTN
MLTVQHQPVITADSPPSTPQLLLQSLAASDALLDGGWWPRSNDPVAELPGLVLALDEYRGPVHRVTLSANGWRSRPHLLGVAGRGLLPLRRGP